MKPIPPIGGWTSEQVPLRRSRRSRVTAVLAWALGYGPSWRPRIVQWMLCEEEHLPVYPPVQLHSPKPAPKPVSVHKRRSRAVSRTIPLVGVTVSTRFPAALPPLRPVPESHWRPSPKPPPHGTLPANYSDWPLARTGVAGPTGTTGEAG